MPTIKKNQTYEQLWVNKNNTLNKYFLFVKGLNSDFNDQIRYKLLIPS